MNLTGTRFRDVLVVLTALWGAACLVGYLSHFALNAPSQPDPTSVVGPVKP